MNRYEASYGTLRGAVSIGGIMSSLELFSLVAGLVGGLAMFLYGMNVMSGGLTKAAGGKLESVLAKVTEHPICYSSVFISIYCHGSWSCKFRYHDS